MGKVRFTIMTVCLNAEEYIEETILSILNQNYDDYECIIKDGGSTDGTLDIVHKLIGHNRKVRIVCEKDKGIYDAMNQALDYANGEYVFFLNAGDCFFDQEVLQKTDAFLREENAAVVYGNILSLEGEKKNLRRYGKLCRNKLYFLLGACICHQAMFARGELFKDRQFSLEYRVCADREWQLYQMSQGVSFWPMNFTVASVLADGFSKNNVDRLEAETRRCLLEYCRGTVWIYDIIMKLKKSKFLLRIIRILERKVFTKNYP